LVEHVVVDVDRDGLGGLALGEGDRAGAGIGDVGGAGGAGQRVVDGLRALGVAGAGDREGHGAGGLVDRNRIMRDRDRGGVVVVEDGGGRRRGAVGRVDLGAGRVRFPYAAVFVCLVEHVVVDVDR